MAHYITEKCTKCGNCQAVCPSDAISEGEDSYNVEGTKCVDCGLCVDECA
ncbi:MAG: 4Fe-4S dicluster domain-containing protein, partial [Syntrophobacterales bacterium]